MRTIKSCNAQMFTHFRPRITSEMKSEHVFDSTDMAGICNIIQIQAIKTRIKQNKRKKKLTLKKLKRG